METVSADRAREPESWRYSRRGERLPDQCLDCGATLVGPYCASCGQKNEPEHRSLWQLVKDAVGPAVLLGSKLWRTLWTLLRHPGALSEAYAEGKRSRYIRPLRLYFWVSVLFFSVLALRPLQLVSVKVGRGDHFSIPFAPELERRLQTKLDRLKEASPGTSVPVGSGKEMVELTPTNDVGSAAARLRLEFMSRLPKALFVLLPVFALLLRGCGGDGPTSSTSCSRCTPTRCSSSGSGWDSPAGYRSRPSACSARWSGSSPRSGASTGTGGWRPLSRSSSWGLLDTAISGFVVVTTMLIALLGT